MNITEVYHGLKQGHHYRRKNWSGAKNIYLDTQRFDVPVIAIHTKDGREGCYAFNNCDFFADDWEMVNECPNAPVAK